VYWLDDLEVEVNNRPQKFYDRINMTDATSGAGTAYPSGAPEFNPGF